MQAVAVVLALACPLSAGPELLPELLENEFMAVVTWIIDGDSIEFRRLIDNEKGPKQECRMLHYNAPEMTGPERPEGQKALKELMRLTKNRRAIIWGVEYDRYGRLLCEVRLMDGTYINDLMREFLKGYKKRDIYLYKEKGQKRRGQ